MSHQKNKLFYLERDFLTANGLFDPCLGDELRDLEPLRLGDFDFLLLLECTEALLPLLDLATLELRDFTESLDLERLRDFRSGDCGDADREWTFNSPEASTSKDKTWIHEILEKEIKFQGFLDI